MVTLPLMLGAIGTHVAQAAVLPVMNVLCLLSTTINIALPYSLVLVLSLYMALLPFFVVGVYYYSAFPI
jgi:hypothetical protein